MTSDPPLVIESHRLTKSYDGRLALDGLDVAVREGRIVGLVGPNGAGKTTCLRCLAGILPATEGTVRIAGIDLSADPVEAKRHLAFIPDTPHLFDYLTVEEHMTFVGRLYQVADVTERTARLLEEFELDGRRRHLPGALSRGMRQKLAISMGFLHDPRAILLDEPLSGLDPLGMRNMRDSIRRRAREEGAAVIVSSHQLELVETLCDEIVIIKEGRLVVAGSLADIRAGIGDATLETPTLETPTLEDVFFHYTLGDREHPST